MTNGHWTRGLLLIKSERVVRQVVINILNKLGLSKPKASCGSQLISISCLPHCCLSCYSRLFYATTPYFD